MNVYAIRDRLLEYFQRPFIGETDKAVLAAVSTAINTEQNVDFAKTPNHFEIWKLCEIDEETGKVTPNSTFLANGSDLLRGGLREGGEQGTHQSQGAARTSGNGAKPTGGEAPPGNHAPNSPI